MQRMTNSERWYDYVDNHSPERLSQLLSDDVVFYSPVVHTPQRGKPITMAYLMAAEKVLKNDSFVYTRDFDCGDGTIFEFELDLDGIHLNGIDMITWNADGQITEFKVMVRPLQAVNKIHEKMGEMLLKMKNRAA